MAATGKAEGEQDEDFETPTQKRHDRKFRLELWYASVCGSSSSASAGI